MGAHRSGKRRTLLAGAALAPLLTTLGTLEACAAGLSGQAAASGSAAAEPASAASSQRAAQSSGSSAVIPAFAALEQELGGRLGVAAISLATGRQLGHRTGERFPMCSTFKAMAAAAILQRSVAEPGLLARRIDYTERDMVPHAPVTQPNLGKGMTVAELCAATVQYSDNPAANLLMRVLGGPDAVTAYARGIGDTAFRLERWETELNSAIPGDPRDTTTPLAMARSLQALVLGDVLPAPQRQQLKDWLVGNTTGAKLIRAGTPAGWTVGDKTGGGAYGARGDIAVLWPPGKAPLVLAIYTAHDSKDARYREDIIARAASAAIALLGHS